MIRSAIMATAVMAVRWDTVYIELTSCSHVRSTMALPSGAASSSGPHSPLLLPSPSPVTTTTLVGGRVRSPSGPPKARRENCLPPVWLRSSSGLPPAAAEPSPYSV